MTVTNEIITTVIKKLDRNWLPDLDRIQINGEDAGTTKPMSVTPCSTAIC